MKDLQYVQVWLILRNTVKTITTINANQVKHQIISANSIYLHSFQYCDAFKSITSLFVPVKTQTQIKFPDVLNLGLKCTALWYNINKIHLFECRTLTESTKTQRRQSRQMTVTESASSMCTASAEMICVFAKYFRFLSIIPEKTWIYFNFMRATFGLWPKKRTFFLSFWNIEPF